MLTLLFVLTALFTIAYVVLLLHYLSKWKPTLFIKPTDKPYPFLSVIIAARNEELSIRRCLRSVLEQSYPAESYEIIVVDDSSEDHTAEYVRGFESIRLLSTHGNQTGKKHALATGIAASRGELIVTTDADCTVQPDWLNTIVGTFDDHTQLVTGPVLIEDQVTIFGRFQAMDLAGLTVITAGGIQSGLHHLANGANMAFRKSAYAATGGFSNNSQYASGDDVFLVQNIAQAFPQSIKYNWHRDAVVLTEPCRTIRSFIQQRLRWASKNKSLKEKSVYRIWMFIWITYVLNLSALTCALIFNLSMIEYSAVFIISIATAEYALLRRAAYHYDQKKLLSGFLLCFVMHYMYVLCIGLAGALVKNYQWKGRQMQ